MFFKDISDWFVCVRSFIHSTDYRSEYVLYVSDIYYSLEYEILLHMNG